MQGFENPQAARMWSVDIPASDGRGYLFASNPEAHDFYGRMLARGAAMPAPMIVNRDHLEPHPVHTGAYRFK